VNNAVLNAIRTRRVVRAMTDEPVPREKVEAILDAARWAPTAGNRHLQRFAATTHPGILRVLRMVSPGMIQRPTAAIVVCVDNDLAAGYGFSSTARGLSVDVGTAAATMLLAAHAIGVGGGPVTSFSRAAVSAALGLPPAWSPEMIICLGRPAPVQPAAMSPRRRLTWQQLTRWIPDRRPTDEPAPGAGPYRPGVG
jgi:nitroreductase